MTTAQQLVPVEVALRDGTRLAVRPVTPEDRAEIEAGFGRLSAESRYRRFMAPTHTLTNRQLAYLLDIDYRDHFAWGALAGSGDQQHGVAVARYVRFSGETDSADTAFTVIDAYQGRGVGSLLLRALAVAAWENRIRRLHFDVLADNRAMLRVLDGFDIPVQPQGEGLCHAVLETESFVGSLRDWPLIGALRDLATAVHSVA